MKKLLLLVLSAFCLGACSVDPVETDPIDAQLVVMDAVFEINGCSVTTFNYADAGRIEVRNDLEFIYLKIIANGDYDLVQSNLHIDADISGFPTTRNGGIIINKMDNQRSFNPAVQEYTYQFPLNSFGDSFLVGAHTGFQLGKKKYNFWAGDLSGNQWSYFEYNLYEHPNAGADKSREITFSAAQALSSWDEVRKVYVGMLDPGVPKGVKVGTFDPSIWDLINRFNHPTLGGVGKYTTVYTIGEGDCTDSVTLTLNVVAD
ncbi:hypothetical protein [Gillisia limnaea]|uniref:DUF5017 domain-containing protein n=1 Tax=Gillisia limnaea (strain DSM 15749 / LMG 21470 / R-8282) TaxID=865937 RepID=H2BRR6_GILLR|nr:hypothetical protein [Gillisia limnaea]EHQ01381.1 hypothetical protein Gilli_0670 [Gillisia limnaea DSM 15749]